MTNFKPIIDADFIQQLIPQKPPFVMVDGLLHFENQKVVSSFTVLPTNIFVQNGFFQAAGLIENMAQTIALYTGYKFHLKNKPAPVGYIGAIKSAEIIKLPTVNEVLQTSVAILHDIMGVTLVSVEVKCGGIIIAKSEMKTALANR